MKYRTGTFVTMPNIHMVKYMSSSATKVYIALLKFSDPNGICYPERDTLREFSGIKDVKTISKCTNELCELGVLEKFRRLDANGSPKSNLYQLKIVGEHDDNSYEIITYPLGEKTPLGRGKNTPTPGEKTGH